MTVRGAMSRTLSRTGRVLQRVADRVAIADTEPTLAGDRLLEWSWVARRLSSTPGRVLDFGAGVGFLSVAAAFSGHSVVAVDLEPCQFPFEVPGIEYVQGDLIELDLEPGAFDQVLNCSTVEHVGLVGRYGSPAQEDGDLVAMRKLGELLRPGGEMLLTLPVGFGGVFAPYHRVYDASRLERLIGSLAIVEETYWAKPTGTRWRVVERSTALAQRASERYYGIGAFVLRRL